MTGVEVRVIGWIKTQQCAAGELLLGQNDPTYKSTRIILCYYSDNSNQRIDSNKLKSSKQRNVI
jgi:hypothetical protein